MRLEPLFPWIDGRPATDCRGKAFDLINPATGEPVATVTGADPVELEDALRSARRAWVEEWRPMAPGRRASILFAIAELLRRHAEELARLEMLNVGKPIADARDEMALGARVFEYYAGAVGKFCGQTIPVARSGLDFTLREPLGVVAAIVPWNFPFPIACWKVAPALAAGNCVILKPASLSPLTALRLGELAHQAGLPAGVLQVLPGPGALLGEALARHPLIDKISFTGSTAIGTRLMALAAPGLKRLSLELGGKSPNIIFADADWQTAADTSPMAVFANAGQDCCARSRVFVEGGIFEEFTARFIEATRAIAVGDPALESTQVGPLVSAAQRENTERYLQESGRTIAAGGRRLAGPGFFFEPTVVLGCEPQDAIWREEVFGPVVCLRPFDNEADLLAEVNDSPYGLSGSIWTRDLGRALRMARGVQSGVLSINSHSSVHVEAPFGGFKQSGLGRDLGMHAMEGYTELKNVFIAE